MNAVQDDFPANPFVGLRPFEAEDSLRFFGRRQQVAELLQRLHQSRLLAVVGSSGCGKSSLVRAGLIPVLQAGFLVEDRDVWFIGKLKPGDTPLANLAACLLKCAGEETSPQAIANAVTILQEAGVSGAIESLLGFLKRDGNLLLLVDQFEEVFRGEQASERDDASDFVSILLALAAQRELPIYIVLTMRSDFIGDCDVFHGLPEALNCSQYLVPRLSREQRREAIEGPVRLYRQGIAARLTDRLLNETVDTRDDLPVLQHALMRTWDHWERYGEEVLDFADYEAIGTIHEALSKDAESAMEGMDDRAKSLTKRLFQSLTTVDSNNRGIRRRVRLDDIAARCGADSEEIWSIVTRFRSEARSFLVVSDEQWQANPLIDISHESLIRQWKTLGTWVSEQVDSIKIYKRLAESDRLYRKKASGLLTDPELQVALDWQAQENPNPAWARGFGEDFESAMAFLKESKKARDLAMAEREFDRRWRRVRNAIGVFVLALFLFNLGFQSVGDFWKQVADSVFASVKAHQGLLLLGDTRMPIALDLNGDGLKTIESEEGFNGHPDLDDDHWVIPFVRWPSPEDGFLVQDRNGNGLIDDGTEMFGPSTAQLATAWRLSGFPNHEALGAGFAALAYLDSSGDDLIDKDDSSFAALRIWQDANSNGNTEPGELETLESLTIVSIKLTDWEVDRAVDGNLIANIGHYQKADGSTGKISEITGNGNVRNLADAIAQAIRVTAHLGLFLGLAFLARARFRALAFPHIYDVLAKSVRLSTKEPKSRVSLMKWLTRSVPNVIERVAKWVSILAGFSILVSCSVAGIANGSDDGWFYIMIGIVISALLVGWVCAVARLNAEVKTLRGDFEQSRKTDD